MNFLEIGELIRKVRTEMGLRLDDLVEMTGISRTTLSSIERGQTSNEHKVRHVMQALGISMVDVSEKKREEEEKRKLDLLLIDQRINIDPEKALAQLGKLGEDYNGPLCTYLKGRAYYKLRFYDQAIQLFNKALKELERMPDLEKTNIRACCMHHLSVIAHRREEKERALGFVEEGLANFHLDGERKPYYYSLLINKSIFLENLGRAEKALENLEQIDFDSADISADSARSLYMLRTKLKKSMGALDDAIACAHRGLVLTIQNYDFEGQLELLTTLGGIYEENGQLNQARKCLESAVALKDKITRRKWLVLDAYLKLAEVYFKQKSLSRTQKILQKALEIAKTQNSMLKYSKALLLIADTLLIDSKYNEAKNYYLEVYEMDVEDIEIQRKTLIGLSRSCLFLNDDDNFRVYSKLLVESYD